MAYVKHATARTLTAQFRMTACTTAPSFLSTVALVTSLNVATTIIGYGAPCLLFGGNRLTAALFALIGQFAGPGLAVLILLPRLRRADVLSFSLPPQLALRRALPLGALYCFAGSARIGVLIDAILSVYPPPDRQAVFAEFVSATLNSSEARWLFLGILVFLGPLVEEVVFRGVLLPWLSKWFGWIAGLAITSLAFALLPFQYGFAMIVLVAYWGIVFGWLRLRTGRLRAPVLLHMGLNGLVALASLLQGS